MDDLTDSEDSLSPCDHCGENIEGEGHYYFLDKITREGMDSINSWIFCGIVCLKKQLGVIGG